MVDLFTPPTALFTTHKMVLSWPTRTISTELLSNLQAPLLCKAFWWPMVLAWCIASLNGFDGGKASLTWDSAANVGRGSCWLHEIKEGTESHNVFPCLLHDSQLHHRNADIPTLRLSCCSTVTWNIDDHSSAGTSSSRINQLDSSHHKILWFCDAGSIHGSWYVDTLLLLHKQHSTMSVPSMQSPGVDA